MSDVKEEADTSKALPKVSAIYIDEKTGTVTLKLATEEEIAKAEGTKNQPPC